MQRLADFMKHEVRDIGNVVNWPLADHFQSLRQPIWRRSDLDTTHDTGSITGTEIRIANFNRSEITCVACGRLDFGLWTLDFRLFYRRDLPTDADMRQAITAI